MENLKKLTYEELEDKLEKVEKEKEFYKTIADNTYDWESFRDASGVLIYVNQAFERISGY